MSALTNVWRKLSRASWDELRVRGLQGIDRRADALRYRLGKVFPTSLSPTPSTREPAFFFSAGEARSVIDLIVEILPDRPKEWVARAERICAHQFDLLGYQDLDYGDRIRWHWDAIHNKEAPRQPWFQVKYLDFDTVGDSKITWELNRHQHLAVLAKAYCASGDTRFRNELLAQWYAWCHDNPYPIGINWASSLEVAFRGISWIWVLRLLEDSEGIKQFRQDVLGTLRLHGRHIQRFLSTYFSPNTHLLGEALGLFFIGTLCPEIPEAATWQREGWQILCREAQRQVRSDGTYFEQSTYYHVYALDMFLHARVLAELNGIQIPPDLDDCISRMLTVLASLGRSGAPVRMGDDDGGRLFDPSRNQARHLLDPLPVGAALYGRPELASAASALCEENIWLLGRSGIEAFKSLRTPGSADHASLPRAFPEGGIYVMQSSDGRSRLTIDAGPLGSLAGGHGHADLLAIHLAVDGREVLTDPGTGEYVGNREVFRATSAHNTLQVDGVSQADPDGPFRWKGLPIVTATWREGSTFQLLRAEHDGYERLASPIRHRRTVFRAGTFFFIADAGLGSGTHDFVLHWNLGMETTAAQPSPGQLLLHFGKEQVSMCCTSDESWQCEITGALISPAYGRILSSSRWRVSTRAVAPMEIATLISVSDRLAATLVRLDGSNDGVTAYLYASAGEYHFFCVGKRLAWTFHDWSSDASFVHIGIRTGQPPSFVACDLSHFTVNGKALVKYDDRVNDFEYFPSSGEANPQLGSWLEGLSREIRESTESKNGSP